MKKVRLFIDLVVLILIIQVISFSKTKKVQINNVTVSSQENVTVRTEDYRRFILDNVLYSTNYGDIHYNLYIPEE